MTVRFPMRDVYKVTEFLDWYISVSKWPADIIFNRNRLTTTWESLTELITSKVAIVHDTDDRMVPYKDVLGALMEQKQGTSEPACSVRWAAGIGDGQKVALFPQSLPASASSLNGKPLSKG